MKRVWTVRVWVETQVLAETPGDAEASALLWAQGAKVRLGDWKAAAFGVADADHEGRPIPRKP